VSHLLQITDTLVEAAEHLITQPLELTQQPIAQYIHQSVTQFARLMATIPPGERALRELVPLVSDDLLTPLTPVRGYALMLREYPAPFGMDTVAQPLIETTTVLHDGALQLQQQLDLVKNEALAQRQMERSQPPQIFNLPALLRDYLPIWQYRLTDVAVQLVDELPETLYVFAQTYHIAGIVQHVVLTMARELMTSGQICLRAGRHVNGTHVEVGIFGTGLQLREIDYDTLFKQQGRHIYRQQIARQGGVVRTARATDAGSSLFISLPLANR
jgi:signal transduction histidine kinase